MDYNNIPTPTITKHYAIRLGDFYVIRDIAPWNVITELPSYVSARPADVHNEMLFDSIGQAETYIKNVTAGNRLFGILILGNAEEKQLEVSELVELSYGGCVPTLVYDTHNM